MLEHTVRSVEHADQRIADWAAASRRPALDAVFVPASFGGAASVPWLAAALALRLTTRRGRRLNLTRTTLATVGGWAIAKTLKTIRHRERPCQHDEPDAIVRCPESSSFPSDQAAAAFAGATSISAAVPELAVPLFAAAILTSLARVYVRVHFPSDVAAGAVVGTLVARAVSPSWRHGIEDPWQPRSRRRAGWRSPTR